MKDFLVDYYLVIILVVALILFAIIGYVVDKMRKKAEKPKETPKEIIEIPTAHEEVIVKEVKNEEHISKPEELETLDVLNTNSEVPNQTDLDQ